MLPLQPKQNVFDIIAIGASAGGVEAICKLISLFPFDLAAAVLVVLHRDPERPSHLHSILLRHAHLQVVIPKQGDRLEYGICYIGTPQQHLMVGPGLHVHLMRDHFYRSHNIDALFNSLARNAGGRTIGVILSGYLKDGTQGLTAIKEAGGIGFVQSPEEAGYPDMLLNAIRHDGPIDLIAPLSKIAEELVKIVGRTKRPARQPA